MVIFGQSKNHCWGRTWDVQLAADTAKGPEEKETAAKE